MARIAGINIPPHKHAEVGLTSIYGIGRTTAQKICNAVGIPRRHLQRYAVPRVAEVEALLRGDSGGFQRGLQVRALLGEGGGLATLDDRSAAQLHEPRVRVLGLLDRYGVTRDAHGRHEAGSGQRRDDCCGEQCICRLHRHVSSRDSQFRLVLACDGVLVTGSPALSRGSSRAVTLRPRFAASVPFDRCSSRTLLPPDLRHKLYIESDASLQHNPYQVVVRELTCI